MDYNQLADLLYPNITKDISFYEKQYPKRQLKPTAEVVRFAPSPTGYLHFGHFMGAYLDSLIAKNSGGIFYFRLEDTDTKRTIDDADKIALKMLQTFGINPDEGFLLNGEKGSYGPYRQSDRKEIYHTFAKYLVKIGRAYPCFCEKAKDKQEILKRREENLNEYNTITEKDICRNLTLEDIKQNLTQNKPFALRFKSANDEKQIVFNDCIKGERRINANTTDFVLIKDNGLPVYHFAHIVDDYLMRTTVVVRGEEWFGTLPLHLEIFDAFGFDPPQYAHTPLIMKKDEITGNLRKISKRKDSEADMRYFLQKGYPVDAVKRYLLTLLNSNYEPWQTNNPDVSYELYPFYVGNINNSNPLFDIAKLDDISKNVISRMSADEVYKNILLWAGEYDLDLYKLLTEHKKEYMSVLGIDRQTERPRKDIVYYSAVKDLYVYINPDFKVEKLSEDFNINAQNYKQFLTHYAKSYEQKNSNEEWFADIKTIANQFNFADAKQYKQNPDNYAGTVADAVKAVRYAITGKINTPTLYEIMNILGKNACIQRLQNFLSLQF